MNTNLGFSENKYQLTPDEIEKLRKDNIKVFEKLFKLFYEPLIQYAYNYLNNVETAENIVQEVFYKIWKNRKRLDPQKNIASYLYKITKNQSFKFLKHKNIQYNYANVHVLDDFDIENKTPVDIIQYKELETAVNKAISSLPEKCYTVYSMNRFNNLSYKAIAEIQGVTIKAIEKQMTRALKILRRQLKTFLTLLFY